MHFVQLSSINLQKTGKILNTEDSLKPARVQLALELRKNIAAVLRCMLPANIKELG